MGKPTGFLERQRLSEAYEPAEARLKHYREFVATLNDEQTRVQGSRCMDCGIPFCNNGCPVNNIIPDWNDLVYRGNWEQALKVLHSTNNFPEFTGRICPAPCEEACTLNINDEAVGIKSIEHAIADKGWQMGWVVPQPPRMKTGKKVMILLLIFVAAVIVYFIHPVGKKEEHGITEYTAMEKAKFPVLYATMGEREMAPVFGQTDERGVTAGRDSLILLPEDRKLKIRFAGTTKIQGVRYEIRSLDTEDLIERTRIGSFETSLNGDSENALSTELPIQNLLDAGKEYLLGVCAELSDGSEAWYYMRITEQDQGHANEMLSLAEDFSSKTYKYSDAQSLTMYMETSPTAGSTSLGTVTLKDTFTQLTWGSLGVERSGEAYTKLKELSGNLANVEITSRVTAKNGEKTENYEVTENFTMKWSSQRIYMMD